MEAPKDIFVIDVEKVVAGKSKKLASFKPFINFLKRIVHQDEINELLTNNHQYEGVEFATHALMDMKVGYNAHYLSDTMPDPSKRYIFVSNHPLGGLDGLILISYIGSTFGDVKFVVNDLLMALKPFKSTFIPINKYGKMKQDYASMIKEAFDSDAQILYFPAGLCSRLIKGKITDLEWKKTFVSKAVESHRDIVPIFFGGRNSMFFYRLAKIRKALGIKFNIETLFLPSEMFKQKNSTFDFYVGETIPVDTITKRHSYKEWTEIIREKCYGAYNQTNKP